MEGRGLDRYRHHQVRRDMMLASLPRPPAAAPPGTGSLLDGQKARAYSAAINRSFGRG